MRGSQECSDSKVRVSASHECADAGTQECMNLLLQMRERVSEVRASHECSDSKVRVSLVLLVLVAPGSILFLACIVQGENCASDQSQSS